MTERAIFNKLEIDKKQIIIIQALDYQGDSLSSNCRSCAACCLAFSVEGLKNHGEKCPSLKKNNQEGFTCTIYNQRPKHCSMFDCKEMKTNTRLQRSRLIELLSAKQILIHEPNCSPSQ